MQRITPVTDETVPKESREPLERIQARLRGRLNIHRTMAASPVVIAAYDALGGVIRERGTFDSATREAIALSVAEINGCEYCLAAHTGLGRRAGLSPDTMRAIRRGDPSGDSRRDAMTAVAREAALDSGSVTESTWTAALAADWSADELTEAFVHIIANVFTNYFNHYAHTQLDLPPAPSL